MKQIKSFPSTLIIITCTVSLSALYPMHKKVTLTLHQAAERRDLTKVQALLTANPHSINTKDRKGNTPLLCAVRGPQKPKIQVWKHGQPPAQSADDETGIDTITYLLQNGAQPDIQNNIKERPLYVAITQKKPLPINSLLDAKANPCEKTPDGQSFLSFTIDQNQPEIAQLLFDYNADIHEQDDEGRNLLHRSLTNSVIQHYQLSAFVTLLLQGKVDVNHTSVNGKSVLEWAIEKKAPETVLGQLVSAGAAITQRASGLTSLYKASPEQISAMLEAYEQKIATEKEQLLQEIATLKRQNDECISAVSNTNSDERREQEEIAQEEIQDRLEYDFGEDN